LEFALRELHQPKAFDHNVFRLPGIVTPNTNRKFPCECPDAGDVVQVNSLDLNKPAARRKDATEKQDHFGRRGGFVSDSEFNVTVYVVLDGKGEHALTLPNVGYSVDVRDVGVVFGLSRALRHSDMPHWS